jgi:biotin carboxyl carrier protein
MKLVVTIDGRAGELQLEQSGEGWGFEYSAEGLEAVAGNASVVEVEPGIYSVLWDSRSFEVKVRWDKKSGVVDIGPEHFVVEAADPREIDVTGGAGAGQSRHEVLAPMPGRVIRVLVEEGQEVAQGQGIAVVEAMKMQNEMQAGRAGRVTSIRVQAGAAVQAGEVLAVIE